MKVRGAVVGPLLLAPLLVVAACGSTGGGAPSGASTSDTGASDASLIPTATAVSPTTGPPNTDPAANVLPPDAPGCDPDSASPESRGEDLELRVQLGESIETGPVRWVLTLTNRGSRAISLVYPSAIDGDVVLRQAGAEKYRWGSSTFGAQVVRCQLIGARQEYRFELPGTTLDVEPGDYQLEASLAAKPTPAPVSVGVTVAAPADD